MGEPVRGDGGSGQYVLRRGPDGVDRIYRRLVPCRHDAAAGIDDGKFIIPVHSGSDTRKGLLGGKLGAHVEQRELELMPNAERFDAVSDGVVVLPELDQIVSNEEIVGHGNGSVLDDESRALDALPQIRRHA